MIPDEDTTDAGCARGFQRLQGHRFAQRKPLTSHPGGAGCARVQSMRAPLSDNGFGHLGTGISKEPGWPDVSTAPW